jgi:predicted transcriptional regulator
VGTGYTLDEIAAEAGTTKEAVAQWRFGFGRSLKRLARDMPAAPQLFEQAIGTAPRMSTSLRPELIEAIEQA